MSAPLHIEGFAIVSADGMIADSKGEMPESIRIPADQKFFHGALDRAGVVVHGRHSHEGGPKSVDRPRIWVTRKVATIAPDPENPRAVLWNPAGAAFEEALRAIRPAGGLIAIIGGRDVFGHFLPLYDAFHLSRAGKARLPGGQTVFPQVGALTPEQVLASFGLIPGPEQTLDAQADCSVVTFSRPLRAA